MHHNLNLPPLTVNKQFYTSFFSVCSLLFRGFVTSIQRFDMNYDNISTVKTMLPLLSIIVYLISMCSRISSISYYIVTTFLHSSRILQQVFVVSNGIMRTIV